MTRLVEKRRFIQVLSGPKRAGKATLALQATKDSKLSFHYASANDSAGKDYIWLQQQWQMTRLNTPFEIPSLLILDEIEKIKDWATTIKQLWDEDTRYNRQLKVLLLSSASPFVQKDMNGSLTGRFEIISMI
ncbi:MAG: AAA family ATPase [Gammaproteobacteria bacterium]